MNSYRADLITLDLQGLFVHDVKWFGSTNEAEIGEGPVVF